MEIKMKIKEDTTMLERDERIIIEFSDKIAYSGRIKHCGSNSIALVENWRLSDVMTSIPGMEMGPIECIEWSRNNVSQDLYFSFIRTLLNPTTENIKEYHRELKRGTESYYGILLPPSFDPLMNDDPNAHINVEPAPYIIRRLCDINQLFVDDILEERERE